MAAPATSVRLSCSSTLSSLKEAVIGAPVIPLEGVAESGLGSNRATTVTQKAILTRNIISALYLAGQGTSKRERTCMSGLNLHEP
jgi:hypothetical protein